MMKISKIIFRIILIIVLGIIGVNTLLYCIHYVEHPSKEIQRVSKGTLQCNNIQENYMVIEEKNSLKNFPYMFGNQVLIQSLSDGKTYYVMNYQNILNKFSPQFYVGDKIYGQVYNGKGTSYDIYEVDVFTGDRRKILEEVNMNDYIVSNGTIVYDKTTLNICWGKRKG
ncbi:MAG: hypothetical protein ACI4D9_06260 [Lachnospiraceae bacterium]